MSKVRIPILLIAGAALAAAVQGAGPAPVASHAPGAPTLTRSAMPQEPSGGTADGATYVGSETCLGCHDGVAEHLGPHGSPAFTELGVHGCETCHGPGSAHVEDPEAWQPTMDRFSSDEQAKICTSCHAGQNQMFWQGSTHDARGLSCITCHSVHAPQSTTAQLKAESAQDVCFSCHKDVRAETMKTSHHPIREGQISCADCHNPHGTQTDSMIRAASINDQCYQCHTEKRGPFLWEHAPVRENCMTCHTPHGSNHLRLQRTSIPYLCQQCHSNTRHPGTLYDARNLGDGVAVSNRLIDRACVNCHAMIHGSNHPSSPYLAH